MKIYSFTFARSGSKGIKNKNLKIFLIKNLLFVGQLKIRYKVKL